MKIDYIVKEELWRSIGAVYWISFLAIGLLILGGYLPVPISYAFPLALVPTVAHFLVMVWYRRKEHLIDPNPMSILRHALRSGEQREEKTKQRRAVIEKAIDAVLLGTVFLIYLYASLAYSINQIYWLPTIVVISILLTRIVFTDGGVRRITFARGVVAYLMITGLALLRSLALGYPVLPLLQVIALVGIVSFAVIFIWERRRTPGGTD